MNRFKLYVWVLCFNVVIFFISLIFKFEYIAGVVNFVSFVVSILLFLFTFEEPPSISKLKIPEVHNRYRSAQNDTNNIIALEFALLSFLFFIMLYSFNLNFSAVILFLWGISVPLTYLIILKNSKDTEVNKIANYLEQFEVSLNHKEIQELTRKLLKANTIDKEKLLAIDFMNDKLKIKLIPHYINYITNMDNELTAGEIEEINDL